MLVNLHRKLRYLRLTPFDIMTEDGRASERQRRIALTAIASALAKLISMTALLVTVPITYRYLGPDRYGMWMTISSFFAIFSFADLGIGNGILTKISHDNGRDDFASIRNVVSSGYAILSSIGLLIFSTFIILYPFINWSNVFNVHDRLAASESGPSIFIFILFFTIGLPLNVVQKVQIGLQNGFVANIWQCCSSLSSLACLIIAVNFKASLPWLVAAYVGSSQIANILNSVIFFTRQRPEIRPALACIRLNVAKAIAFSGFMFFIMQMSLALLFSSDSLIIAQYMGAGAVAQYAVPEKLFALITSTLLLIMMPLWPAYGEANARNDLAWVKSTLKRSLALGIGYAAICSVVLITFADQILSAWIGKGIVVPLALLVSFGVLKVVESITNAISVFLNGANQIKIQVYMAVMTASTAIGLKLYLAGKIGILGPVLGSIVALLLFSVVPGLIFAQRYTGSRLKNSDTRVGDKLK